MKINLIALAAPVLGQDCATFWGGSTDYKAKGGEALQLFPDLDPVITLQAWRNSEDTVLFEVTYPNDGQSWVGFLFGKDMYNADLL